MHTTEPLFGNKVGNRFGYGRDRTIKLSIHYLTIVLTVGESAIMRMKWEAFSLVEFNNLPLEIRHTAIMTNFG